MNDTAATDPRLYAIPDTHGHAKGEHKAFIDERPIPLSARMLFLWFYHACRRGWPRFMMVTDHVNYLTFEDPAAINLVRRALKLAQAGDLYGAAETASVEVGHAAVVSEGLRRGMRYSIGAEVDNDPRSRPDAQNIVDAMKPDGMIRSVHFLVIDHPTHGPGWNWPFDNPEFADVFELVGTAKTWELYMATLLDALERLPGNILGHFYVPAIFGHWPDDETLDAYENQIVDACEARGMAIEFNTRFLYRDHPEDQKAKYLAAYRRLLSKCKAKNVGIAVGSDAHSPKDQGSGFEAVLALLDECEINELVFPIAGRLARVALRVERKVEAVPEPPPAPPAEERKAVRRVRPEAGPAEEPTATAAPADEEIVPVQKVKARPAKRSKAKLANGAPAEPAEPSAEQTEAEPAVALEADSIVSVGLSDIVSGVSPEPIVESAVATPEVEAGFAVEAEVRFHGATSEGFVEATAPEETAVAEIVGPADAAGTRPSRSRSGASRAKAEPEAKAKMPGAPAKKSLKAGAKKSAVKVAGAKKVTAKKAATATKKAVTKKVAAAKSAAKPAAAKKAPAKKTAAKKAQAKKPPRRR